MRYNRGVARAVAWTGLVVASAVMVACAGVDEPPVVDASADVTVSRPDAGDSGGATGCFAKSLELDLHQADVLLLLDRSSSMDTAFGSGTRHDAVAAVLSSLVQTYATHVRFGLEEMPGRQGCDGFAVAGCCASSPVVGIAEGNTQSLLASIAGSAPMDGNTPTAAALRAARDYYASLDDAVPDRYVLLATDGIPNCTITGGLTRSSGGDSTDPACADALAEVSTLAKMDIRTIVLGVGSGLSQSSGGVETCLDALAHAGGAAASPGLPGFYTAADPVELQLAIEQIFGGVSRPACTLPFKRSLENDATLAVFLDGREIPKSKNDVGAGWVSVVNSAKRVTGVRVVGVYCDMIQTFQVGLVEARFGCPPCVEGSECIGKDPT
jgi:hypothetical protein